MSKDEPNGLDPEELKELEQIMALQSKVAAGTMDAMSQTKFMRRSERVQVASRVLAALVPIHFKNMFDNLVSDEARAKSIAKRVSVAVETTDALLARIDGTEDLK